MYLLSDLIWGPKLTSLLLTIKAPSHENETVPTDGESYSTDNPLVKTNGELIVLTKFPNEPNFSSSLSSQIYIFDLPSAISLYSEFGKSVAHLKIT